MNWLCQPNACPGLYYGTSAQDGFLVRLRTPGGLISLAQAEAIALLMENCHQNTIQVTNRGNLQMRGVKTAPAPAIYHHLQQLGLASANPELDQLRNVMLSPTAGIDPEEILDTRPLLRETLNYLNQHPALKELSPKFSLGIDGGGQVSLGNRCTNVAEHRYNEIQFSAVKENGEIYLHLALGGAKQLWDTGILVKPRDCISLLHSLISVYLDYGKNYQGEKKPRLRHLLQDWGLTTYLEQVSQKINHPYLLTKVNLYPSIPYKHLGIQPQKQKNLSYLGLSLPLGHLSLKQWQGLIELGKNVGSEEIRLTPWQSILLPNLPREKLGQILAQLEELDLSVSNNPSQGAIIACAGKQGCKSALTETQTHGMKLITYLKENLNLPYPVNIHLTACSKSCAQPSPAEITLLGTMIEQEGKMLEGYRIYVGGEEIAALPFVEVLPMIETLVKNRKLKIKND